MIRKITILLLIVCCQFVIAQEVKFGKVTKNEILEKSYPLDSSANAAILYKYRNSYFDLNGVGIQMITEVQQKIKVYNQQGFDYATHKISLYNSGRSRERVVKMKAYTYNLEGDEIVKTELEKDQIFKSEFNDNFDEVKFTMPNLKEGSVIEFKYKVISPFYQSIDEFEFQHSIPIKKIEAHIKTPKGLIFRPTHKGYITFFPKRSTVTRANVVLNKDTYELNDVPALKEEIYVDNIDNYRAGIMFELVSVDLPGFYKSFAQSWEDVAKSIGGTDQYKKRLNETKSFEEEISQLISSTSNKEERMKIIFKYVKENVKWNGNNGKYFQYGIKKALKEKKGNVADINLMLVAMMRFAKIEANPVVISTKDNSIPFFPTLDRLNYVIAHAIIDEEPYFLDATDEFSNLNLLPIKDYNWQGIYINNKDEIWKQISIKKPEQAITQYQLSSKLFEDGSMEGTYKSRLTEHYSYQFKENIKDQDMDEFISDRESNFNDIEISDYEVKNVDTFEGKVNESFTYYLESGAESIDKKIFIKPLTFLRMEENPFKLDSREYPIDFGYAFKDLYIVNIEIPEGYEVETPISPFRSRTPDGNAEFKYLVSTIGNKIQVSVSLDIKKAIHGAETYLFLKEFFNQVINKEAEQLVLTKTKP